MKIQQLEYFIKLAETEHMQRAADEIHISQSALSTNLAKLEADLGVLLFDRKGRNITLNHYGRTFLPDAVKIVGVYSQAVDRLNAMKHRDDNRIRIMGASLLSFPNLLKRLHSTCPDVLISSMNCSYDEVAGMLINGDLDYCITAIEILNDQLDFAVLRRDELVILVPEKHPLADKRSAKLEDFSADNFADYPKSSVSRSEAELFCAQAGFIPNLAFEGKSIYDLIEAVKTGLYVTFIPFKLLKNYDTDGTRPVRIESPHCYSCLRMYWRKGVREKDAVRLARKIILGYFGDTQDEELDSEIIAYADESI